MIEERGENPNATKLLRRVQDTEMFLRLAAIELRRISGRTPDISQELRHVVQQLEAEAAALARLDTK